MKSWIMCRAYRHVFSSDEVSVIQVTINEQIRWVTVLQCDRCGVYRTDVMMPRTYERISTAYSDYPSDYDTAMTPQEAKKKIFKGRKVTKV